MVYIDDARNEYKGMLMSHMMADSLEELHEFAGKLGLKRSWLHNSSNHPHYDICQSKKKLAISLGAKEVTTIELVTINNKNRQVKNARTYF